MDNSKDPRPNKERKLYQQKLKSNKYHWAKNNVKPNTTSPINMPTIDLWTT